MGWGKAPGVEVQTSFQKGGRVEPVKGSPKVICPCCDPIQESSERTQKKLCPSTQSSVLAEAKGSALASDSSTESKAAREPCLLSAPDISVKEAAAVVVKYLTPFYKEGRFMSKVGCVGLEDVGQGRGWGWPGMCTLNEVGQRRPLSQGQLLPTLALPCPWQWWLQGSVLLPFLLGLV